MRYLSILLLLFLVQCRSGDSAKSPFNGSFSGTQNGVTSSAELQAEGKSLSGKLLLGGSPASVTGTIDGSEASGSIHDEETGKDYSFTASVRESGLRFSIRFPELNNQEVELSLQRQGAAPGTEVSEKKSKGSGSKSRDGRLVGTWKHSEVLSSNSGGSYMSLATEFFVRFDEDGTAWSWTGESAGMGGYGGADPGNADKGQWYTRGNLVVFVDPASGEEASSQFSVDETRLLLSNGSEKKIYQRVE